MRVDGGRNPFSDVLLTCFFVPCYTTVTAPTDCTESILPQHCYSVLLPRLPNFNDDVFVAHPVRTSLSNSLDTSQCVPIVLTKAKCVFLCACVFSKFVNIYMGKVSKGILKLGLGYIESNLSDG